MLDGGDHATALFKARGLRASRASMHVSATSLLCYSARAARPASAFEAFCEEQRPLMSGSFARGEKEALLSQQWKALSKLEKVHYKVHGTERRNRARGPYNAFCQAQRPNLPPDLRNSQREKTLGQLWAALTRAEKAEYAPVLAPVPALVTTAPVRAQALPMASWSTGSRWSWQPLEHRSAPPLEADRSRGKRAKTAARDSPSAALTTAPLPAPAQPMAVAVATAVEGSEVAATATVAAGWAMPFAFSALSTTAEAGPPTSPTPSTSTSCTDTSNGWEEILEEVLGLDGLFNSLEAEALEYALTVRERSVYG